MLVLSVVLLLETLCMTLSINNVDSKLAQQVLGSPVGAGLAFNAVETH